MRAFSFPGSPRIRTTIASDPSPSPTPPDARTLCHPPHANSAWHASRRSAIHDPATRAVDAPGRRGSRASREWALGLSEMERHSAWMRMPRIARRIQARADAGCSRDFRGSYGVHLGVAASASTLGSHGALRRLFLAPRRVPPPVPGIRRRSPVCLAEGFIFSPAEFHDPFGKRTFELGDIGLKATAAMPAVSFVEANPYVEGNALAGVLRAFLVPRGPQAARGAPGVAAAEVCALGLARGAARTLGIALRATYAAAFTARSVARPARPLRGARHPAAEALRTW